MSAHLGHKIKRFYYFTARLDPCAAHFISERIASIETIVTVSMHQPTEKAIRWFINL